MKKKSKPDRRTKTNHFVTSIQSKQITLPRISEGCRLNLEPKSKSPEKKKKSYLEKIKSKLEILTKIKKDAHEQRKKNGEILKAPQSQEKTNNRRSILHKEEEKQNILKPNPNRQILNKRSVVYRNTLKVYEKESAENQVKILFNGIQDQLNSPKLSPTGKQNGRSHSVSNIVLMPNYKMQSLGGQEQLLDEKTNANKDVKSMIATFETEINRLNQIWQRNEDSITDYMKQKISSLDIEYYFRVKKIKQLQNSQMMGT